MGISKRGNFLKMSKTKAIYAGMFDPLTLGHCSIIEKASKLPFDEIVVAITINSAKKSRFELAERLEMVNKTLDWMGVSGKVTGDVFTGQFVVNYCKEVGATHLIRGIRDARDYEYELGVLETDTDIDSSIEHVFLPTERQYQRVSSTLVMSLIGPKGWQDIVKKYVPKPVYERLLTRGR
jgi:pantetheine-phosphate adenylyltransferase